MSVRIFVLATIAATICLVPGNIVAQTAREWNDKTIDEIVDLLNDKARTIDAAGDSSKNSGNYVLAQKQYLLHDIIKRSTEQLHVAYERKLGQLLRQFDDPTRDAMSRFVDEVDKLPSGDNMASHNPSDDVYKLQGTANKMFENVFAAERHPIIYGMLISDLLADGEKHSKDIEIFGFDIVDKTLKMDPEVSLSKNGTSYPIPAESISANGDDILVDIPKKIKDIIHFVDDPCLTRETFSLAVTAFTSESHGVWPFKWKSEVERNFELHAMPTARNYELYASYDFERSISSVNSQSFSQKSDLVSVGCADTVSASIEYKAPPGAQDISCAASWVDASAVKDTSQNCRINGDSIEGHGSITGMSKICTENTLCAAETRGSGAGPNKSCSVPALCACSQTGHGWLQIDGAYKLTQVKPETVVGSPLGEYQLPAESGVTIPVKLENIAKLKHIGVVIKQKSCPTVFDRLDFIFAADTTDVFKGISKNGLFRATYADGQLVVKNSTTESTAGGVEPN